MIGTVQANAEVGNYTPEPWEGGLCCDRRRRGFECGQERGRMPERAPAVWEALGTGPLFRSSKSLGLSAMVEKDHSDSVVHLGGGRMEAGRPVRRLQQQPSLLCHCSSEPVPPHLATGHRPCPFQPLKICQCLPGTPLSFSPTYA